MPNNQPKLNKNPKKQINQPNQFKSIKQHNPFNFKTLSQTLKLMMIYEQV